MQINVHKLQSKSETRLATQVCLNELQPEFTNKKTGLKSRTL